MTKVGRLFALLRPATHHRRMQQPRLNLDLEREIVLRVRIKGKIKINFVPSHPTLLQDLLHRLTGLSFGNEEKTFDLLSSFLSSLQVDLERTSELTGFHRYRST